MRSVNKVILIGNLTRNPELKETQNGQSIVTFGIATNREWTTGDSDRKKSTEFHEVVAWAKLAEICAKYLKTGRLVYLEGYLKTRSWETENGDKKYRTEVVLEDMIMLEKKSDSDDHVSEKSDKKDVEDSSPEESESTESKESTDSEEENVF
ncbi:single-stranded DNA-binding protein [Candidatus Peregrinibacteria bacterium]|jgi:single-strand DNA-binding protein|nr:single-stranded DNA-binding protein [Candidatus Peregrinibacteria bacterium]MBT7736794.1 single-stranded DNA-binding protein [Candidatus Peregrinibacteria bacterium]